MKYVDAFVCPVPKRNLKKYKVIANFCKKLYKKYGAINYLECIADDVKKGKSTSFPQSVKLKPGEVVVIAYVTYKSRAHRDRVNKKVMNDPKLREMCESKNMPFDGKRLFWGGFKTIIEM